MLSQAAAPPQPQQQRLTIIRSSSGFVSKLALIVVLLAAPFFLLWSDDYPHEARRFRSLSTEEGGDDGGDEDYFEGATTTILLGIFTTRSDYVRRETIRREMLRAGKNGDERVCRLNLYLAGYRNENSRGDAIRPDLTKCRVLYTFVVGAEHDATLPEDHYDSSGRDLIYTNHRLMQADNVWDDITYLNVKENNGGDGGGGGGKAIAFFKYASQFVDEYKIDYVFKSQSDSFVALNPFIQFVNEDLPPAPPSLEEGGVEDTRKMYGGIMFDYNLCTMEQRKFCHLLVGKVFMDGQLYFVSSDLAKYVSSDDLDRSKMTLGVEDLDFGTYVLSYPQAVKLVVMTRNMVWIHDERTQTDEGIMEFVTTSHNGESGGYENEFPMVHPIWVELDMCMEKAGADARMEDGKCMN